MFCYLFLGDIILISKQVSTRLFMPSVWCMNTLIPNKSLDSDKDTHTHRCSEWTHATGTACRRAFLDLFMWRGMGRITCVSRDTKQTDILVRMMEKTCMHTVRQTYMYSWHTDRQTDKLTERERESVCAWERKRESDWQVSSWENTSVPLWIFCDVI